MNTGLFYKNGKPIRIGDKTKRVIIAENSTGRIQRLLCPVCCNEIGVNDTQCIECNAQLTKI